VQVEAGDGIRKLVASNKITFTSNNQQVIALREEFLVLMHEI
jgi:hypothetical protein